MSILCVFWHRKLATHTLVADCHQRYKMSCISDLTLSALLRLHWLHLITFVLQNIWERC